MKKSLNKSLFVAVVVAILSFVCAVASFNFSANVANAEEALAVPTTYTTAGETEFYLQDGASVRLESSGIKFQSVVTKDFHNEISANGTKSVVYYATANAVGKKAMALKFPIQPDFTSSDSVELRTYINFLSLEDDSAAAIAAYAVDFATSSYAQVDNGDGTYTYYRAFSEAKTGDNDILRSMRAVANAAALKGEEGVEKYFTLGKRDNYNGKDVTSAYLFTDGTAYVDIPEVSAETVVLYNGAKPLGEYTYNAEKGVYAGTLPGVVAGDYISAFVDGKVYSTKAANATKIVDVNGFKAFETLSGDNGVYVIDADLDLSSITSWAPVQTNTTNAFKGVVDGLQHTLSNFKVSSGIFHFISGALVKNLNLEVVGYNTGRYQGTITSRAHNSAFENIYVDVISHSGATSASGLIGVVASGGTTCIVDCVVVMRAKSAASFVSANGDRDALFTTRMEGVTSISNSYGINATAYELAALGERTSASVRVVLNGKDVDNLTASAEMVSGIFDFDSTKLSNDFLKACYEKTADALTVKELTQENFEATLEGATSGYYLLTEDIDMSGMTWSPTGGTFTGVLDGNGFAIKNFTAPAGYSGLLPHVNGAVIRNLNLHVVNNTTYSALAGQVKGPVLIENCVIDIDTISANHAGLFTIIQGDITANNVIVNIDTAAATYGVGFLGGRASASKNIMVSNCYFISGDGKLTNVYEGDNYAVAADTGVVTEGTIGTDKQPAVAGEDYKLSLAALGDDIVEGKVPEILVKGANKLGIITLLDSTNIEILETATTGYFILTEDVDMTSVCANTGWAPTQTSSGTDFSKCFAGTLNGNGFTLSNFTVSGNYIGLFNHCGGTITPAVVKNITIEMTNTPARAGIFGRSVGKGVEIHDSVIYTDAASTTNGSCIVNVCQAPVIIEDTTVIYKTKTNGVAYVGTTEAQTANGDITLSNFVVIDMANTNAAISSGTSYSVNGADGLAAVANEDYFIYSGAEATIAAIKAGKISKDVETLLAEKQCLIPISQENITDLQTIISGYIYLTEDIDMAGITWNPTAGFAATLDGNGHTIKNFTAPAGYAGLVGNTAAGATIKNLTLHALTNGNRAVLTGQIKGATTVSNCKFNVEQLSGLAQAVIANVVQETLTVSDTYIVIGSSVSADRAGIVAGGEAASHNVTVSNVYAYSASGLITDMYKGNDNDDANLKETTIGTDGKLAVNGEDYVLYADTAALIAAAEAGTINAGFKAFLIEVGAIKELTNANFADMQNGGSGYWYLAEDIDMTTVDFNGAEEGLGSYNAGSSVFAGTFDGKGHTISGFRLAGAAQSGLFVSLEGNATIKNLIIKATNVNQNNNGVLAATFRNTGNVIENVVIDVERFAAYNGGIVARNLAGEATLKDVMIIVRDSAINGTNGLVFGNYAAAANATVDGLYIVDLATAETKITNLTNGYPVLLGTDGAAAVQGEDYFYVTNISDINANGISTELRALIEVANPGFFG